MKSLNRFDTLWLWPFLIVFGIVLQAPVLFARQPLKEGQQSLAVQVHALASPHAEAGLLSGVLLIARDGHILVQRAYGYANWELKVPNTITSRFGIASITKVMTEVLVHHLVKEGRLQLETPVEQHLQGFPRGPKGGVPTVGHLLNHRAGVPHRVTEVVDETQPLSASDIVERVKKRGLHFEPGSRRLYSSAGYTCLARVIEVVEKEPFDSILARRVFRLAGMKSATGETGQNLLQGRAMPYRLGTDGNSLVVKNTPYKDLRFLTGAGSVYATAEDLLRFAQAFLNGDFGAELRDDFIGDNIRTWVSLTGRTSGYEASVDVIPSEKLVFIFLSNLRSSTNWQLRERIQQLLAGQSAAVVPLPPPVAKSFEEPQSIIGTYGSAEITILDGQLLRGESEFYPVKGGRYYIPASGTVMFFRRDSTGSVDALVSVSGGGRESILEKSTE